MLDILAYNDWKRPIYFSGGSMDSAEYIWMKEYLQLDGLVYKLVPIKTEIDKKHPFDMGRIDSNLMYDIIKKWDWGNMGKAGIYLDPETRKNSIIFRGNLARLTEKLIEEGKLNKAKDILDIGMKHMPLEAYGYYFTLDPFVQGYFKVGEKETARKLALQIFGKYQEELNYYAHLSPDERYANTARIQYTIDRYGELLLLIAPLDKDFYEKQVEVLRAKASPFMKSQELDEYMKMLMDEEEDTLVQAGAEKDSGN